MSKKGRPGGRLLNLKWAATCEECGRNLPVNTPARFYNSRRIYCPKGKHVHEVQTEPMTEICLDLPDGEFSPA